MQKHLCPYNSTDVYSAVDRISDRVCSRRFNTRFPLLRFRSTLHCGYSGITDIQDGLFFVLTVQNKSISFSLGFLQ
jgi:hypothetical protein